MVISVHVKEKNSNRERVGERRKEKVCTNRDIFNRCVLVVHYSTKRKISFNKKAFIYIYFALEINSLRAVTVTWLVVPHVLPALSHF